MINLTLFVSYCSCDRTHGGIDCSIELVSHRGIFKFYHDVDHLLFCLIGVLGPNIVQFQFVYSGRVYNISWGLNHQLKLLVRGV